MQIEYEAKFLNINIEEVRAKLKNIGAQLVRPEFLMRRVVFVTPSKIENAWLRVRDEGDKITMSLKIDGGEKIHDQKESQIMISDFTAGCKFLESIGARKTAYQENKREVWKQSGVEFDIDTWPGLNTFLEIEGVSEEVVKKAASELGFDWSGAVFGSVGRLYIKELGINIDEAGSEIPEITFTNPPVLKK